MEFFSIYDIDSGEELTRGSGPEGTARLQPLGQTRGVVVIPPEAMANLTPLHEIDPAALRSSLWDFAKTIKSQMLVRGALTQWGVVDSDAQSILNLQMKAGAAMYLTHEGAVESRMSFTMQDNTEVELTPGNMMKLVGQAMAFLDSIHEYARYLRRGLDVAKDADEVLSVDIFRGWPSLVLPQQGE